MGVITYLYANLSRSTLIIQNCYTSPHYLEYPKGIVGCDNIKPGNRVEKHSV